LIARLSLPFGRLSLRSQLLLGILLPVLALIGLNTASLYAQALRNANLAYDRTLLASAKVIGEQLEVDAAAAPPRLRATVPYSALEAFEADTRSRMVYKVSGFDGETVSGYEDLPRWNGRIPPQPAYAALVDFYDDHYNGEAVRVAVLLQPVAGGQGGGMATIQVAETLELRQALARQILFDTLWRQALLVLVISAVVLWVVQRATQPVRELSQRMLQRAEHDLAPIGTQDVPRELLPLVAATNQVMARLAHLLADQKRFVRDTAHQLRTPLAVLRTQLQSAMRGDVAPAQALQEMQGTVERATVLANQMLSLAKVEQLRQQGGAPVLDWAEIVRAVALDLAPLIAQAGQDFEIDTMPAPVRAHEWALRELTRNLLHNALKYNRPMGRLAVRLAARDGAARLHIADDGPGIAPGLRQRLFQPFAAGDPRSGSGLGLAICQEIVASLGGDIRLDNRLQGGQVAGLDAVVSLPLADNPVR
jgi:two-component system sensor histidine kinase TctE